MAQVIAALTKLQRKPGIKNGIPWERYADGQTWQLMRGEDFHQTPWQALKAGRKWAARHGLGTIGTCAEATIIICMVPKTSAMEAHNDH